MGRQMLRGVYPERSEGLSMTFPVLGVTFHNRGLPALLGLPLCLLLLQPQQLLLKEHNLLL